MKTDLFQSCGHCRVFQIKKSNQWENLPIQWNPWKCNPCMYMCVCVLSHVWLFATPWTIAHQAPLSMRFPSQEYWSGLPTNYPSSKWGLQKIQASFIIWTLSKFLLTKVNNQSIWIAWDIYRCLGLNKFKETKKCVMQPIDLWHPTPVLLAGKSHRRRILVGCSPWGR